MKREGEMTKMMGVVSYETFSPLIERTGFDCEELIPFLLVRQQTCRDKVKSVRLNRLSVCFYSG
jgi:hypothetical protein